jgi:hypothetical protein
MRNGFVRLGVESLETRDNPSGGWSFWDDTYVGAFLSGIGEGGVNIATGARDTVVELGRTGRDLVTIYGDWNNIDPTRLESKLFQGAASTAGNPDVAASYDRQLVFGITTLGVGPLVQSGYNAVVTGDSTEFSQQAGGFGVMVLVPYAGVKGLNALPNVPVRLPTFQPGAVLQTVDGAMVAVPGGVAWETVGVITFAVPAEAATAIAGTGAVFSVTINGGGGSGQNMPSNFNELVEQAVQEEWAQRGDLTADAMTLVDLEGPKACANPDPLLGPNQVRYQAQFVNEFTGEVIDVSVNYDPTTGQFGTIKPASGK